MCSMASGSVFFLLAVLSAQYSNASERALWRKFSPPLPYPASIYTPPISSNQSQPPAAALSDLATQFLDPHNQARSQVGVPNLSWNEALTKYAESWANQRAAYGNCEMKHSGGPYGENIFWGSGKAWSATDAVEAWVAEKKFYNYNSNACQEGQQCGHYTQIIWKSTKFLGCARVVCSSGKVFVTCNYDPPGNYIGRRPY